MGGGGGGGGGGGRGHHGTPSPVPPATSPRRPRYEWHHFDHGNLLIKNHYVLYCITPLTPLYYLYFVRLSTYLFSLFSPSPTAPANADLALHTKLFPTILRHKFISITKGNTYQIVFVSLIYFSFSYLPTRRFDRQEKPFLMGPPLHIWGTFGSEGEENF